MELNLEWITEESNMGPAMVEWAKDLGEKLAKGKEDRRGEPSGQLTTSQIRKFYGEVKRIQADWDKYSDDVPMLNAKLAYAVGRKNEYGIKTFANTFYDAIMKASEAKEYFDRLVKILEATVAYHKFYGGKD
jgi:CRISPR-associated protein Csm2